jgi:hypothetical protein
MPVAGILKYLSSTAYRVPLLAIGLAPVVIGLALLITCIDRMLSSFAAPLVFTGHSCAEQPAKLRSAALCDHGALCLPFVDLTLRWLYPALVERSPAPAAAGRCAAILGPIVQRHQRLLPERRSVMPRGSSKS